MNRVVAALAVFCSLFPAVPVQAQQTDQKKQDESKEIVYTNADLPPALPENSVPSSLASASTLPVAATTVQPSYGGHRDRNGHGEGWWRYRAAELDIEVLAARYLAEQLHVDYVKGKELTDSTLKARSREATLAWRELEAERERLPEDLRQAGGFPGWLRRGDTTLPDEVLPPPVPEGPVLADGLTLTWKPVVGAAFYLIEVQCTDCCGLLEPCEPRTLDVARASARFPFESDGSGRFRVRALDAAGFPGEWSDWLAF